MSLKRSKRSKRNGRRQFTLRREKRSVCILTPCDDTVKTDYATSLLEMVMHTMISQPPNLDALFFKTFSTSILPAARDQLASFAVNSGATHALWIDSDMKFPRDMLLRFLRRDEKIIGINAMSRRSPFATCAQLATGEPLVTNEHSTGLEKVHRTGFGVLWVATDVLAAMPPPRFGFDYLPDSDSWLGEDYVFFEKARALGHEFYVDHDLSKEIFHMGQFGYSPMMVSLTQEARN